MSDPIFQRGLQDLIKGIRSHKKDPSSFISQAIVEIKAELRSTDAFIKAEAVRKLTYLQMLGYNVGWASFAVVEVMAQPRFGHKRIGYLAANQSFDESTDVILLTTNLFKKEFASISINNQYEIGLAINCLANIATKDLSRDCISDLVTLMNHSKPYVRKKAVLAMYKLYIKFPQGLRLTFDKLKERLEDPESSVVSTAVNVICELANKNPRNYLAMAPKFFRLLTTSSNNWMLIKVVKLFGSLVSEEPRLARKLLEPLATIIQNTGAKSLQYECIYTVTEALPHSKREDGTDAKNAQQVIKLCSDYLRGFIEDTDQNLKYLGLVGLARLMRCSVRSAVEQRDLVLKCLNDDDVTIRSKALEILAGIVSKKSLVDLVQHLMEHARRSEGTYRDEIISKILFMCKKEKYSLVLDFAWYVSILLDLAVMQGSKHGGEVADQLIEIAMRVDAVRPFAVETMLSMLLNDRLIMGQSRQTVGEVLKAAAWIVGEYAEIVSLIAADVGESLDDAEEEEDGEGVYWIEGTNGEEFRSIWRGQNLHHSIIESLLHPRATNLSPQVQTVYVQAAMKIFVRAVLDCEAENLSEIVSVVRTRLTVFMQSENLEIQERANSFRYLLADLDILSINWEDETELAAKEEEEAKAKAPVNLLDMPLYTPSSVKAVDDHAAAVAQQKSKVLQMITNEKFYSVHSKAQRRVPMPEGLNLEQPFNSKALQNLLAIEIPENITIQALSIVAQAPFPGAGPQPHELDLEEARIANVLGSSFNAAVRPNRSHEDLATTAQYSEAPSSHTGTTAGSKSSGADDVFMLGRGAAADIMPLSKLLGEFEEIPGKQKKSKKQKGGGKKKASGIDTTEMLPAGAEDSDEEDRRGGKGRKKAAKGEGLANVDITAPLRADEVLPVPTHRVVPAPSEETPKERKKEKKSSKHSKGEDSKKKHRKDKESAAPSTVAPPDEDNLLGLDFSMGSAGAMAMTPPKPVSTVEPTAKSKLDPTPASSSASKSKKSSGTFWAPCHSDKHVDICYAGSCADSTLTVQLKTLNHCRDGSAITAVLSIPAAATHRNAVAVKCADNLKIQADTKTVFVLELTSPLVEPISVRGTAAVTLESLLGPETHQVPIQLSFNVCSTLSPHKLDEDAFLRAVGKSSSRWGSASAQLSGSGSKMMKAVSGYLHAHVVETESSRACSMSAKAPNGDVFILVKSAGDVLHVEVKCLCRSKSESSSLADAIVRSLQEVTF